MALELELPCYHNDDDLPDSPASLRELGKTGLASYLIGSCRGRQRKNGRLCSAQVLR